ncbi:hypothetical protein GW17_00024074 [Ensete ventricosum]|nr:hypothetical protein GW17_00024074 [Ensete ventricosum]
MGPHPSDLVRTVGVAYHPASAWAHLGRFFVDHLADYCVNARRELFDCEEEGGPSVGPKRVIRDLEGSGDKEEDGGPPTRRAGREWRRRMGRRPSRWEQGAEVIGDAAHDG